MIGRIYVAEAIGNSTFTTGEPSIGTARYPALLVEADGTETPMLLTSSQLDVAKTRAVRDRADFDLALLTQADDRKDVALLMGGLAVIALLILCIAIYNVYA